MQWIRSQIHISRLLIGHEIFDTWTVLNIQHETVAVGDTLNASKKFVDCNASGLAGARLGSGGRSPCVVEISFRR